VRTHGAQADACARDAAIAPEDDMDGGSDAREVADLALELEIGTTRLPVPTGIRISVITSFDCNPVVKGP